jgi:hypothetical protein
MIHRRTRHRFASREVPVALLATKHIAGVQQALQPWPIALDLIEIHQGFIAAAATTHLRMERLPALRHEAQQGLTNQQDAKRNHGPIPPGTISYWTVPATVPLRERRLQIRRSSVESTLHSSRRCASRNKFLHPETHRIELIA